MSISALILLEALAGLHVFAAEHTVVFVDDRGAIISRVDISKYAELKKTNDFALSPNGQLLAVTAWAEPAKNYLLYVLDVSAERLSIVGTGKGFHGAPAFSEDGLWLYFAHHPTLGGPVGMHEGRQYAQLSRVQLSPNAAPETLTSSNGCHMGSAPVRSGEVYFAHSDCMGGRRIEVLRDGVESAVTDFDSHLGEPNVVQSQLVASRTVGDTLAIVLVDLKLRKQRDLWSGVRIGSAFRPQLASDGKTVIFQNGRDIFRLSGKSMTDVERIGRVE